MKNRRNRTLILLLIFFSTLACSTLTNAPSIKEPEYRYDDLPEAGDEDAAISEYRTISQWNKSNITFFFINSTSRLQDDTEQVLVRQAFDLWSRQTPLTFTEVFTRGEANIVIGWASGEHGDGDPFDGPGDVLAHASFPNPYDDRQVFLHFDDDERWVNSNTQNVDLLTVAAHEIGHTLGLAHSNDPNALMYPSYGGPHRFLDEDDIAGVQSLYGVASAPQPGPNVPQDGAPNPPSKDTDSDNDGISDRDETLLTGTNPNNADSDGDGLSDGVEVINRMNPLDGDMDKDGVSDGQEIANGTNPFIPEETNVSPELESEVSEFLTRAIELQMEAYRKGDASIASSVLAGGIFDNVSSDINSLNEQGLASISEIDYYESYINAIRVIDNTNIEVDSCEVWTTSIYRRSDGKLVQGDGPALLPQTITIQKLEAGWFITAVNFFEAPSFCN